MLNNKVDVMWQGDHFIALVGNNTKLKTDFMEQVPGRSWSPEAKRWMVGLGSARQLEVFANNHDVRFDEASLQMINRANELLELSRAVEDAPLVIPGLVGELKPYQRAAVRYTLSTRRVLLADDMGAGKSACALAAIEIEGTFPVVVVCPANLKINWFREIKKWLPHRSVSILDGEEIPTEQELQADFIVVNYNLIGHQKLDRQHEPPRRSYPITETLMQIGIRALIVDESHYVKENNRHRTTGVKMLSGVVPNDGLVMLLSGTPVVNRPKELIAQLDIMGRLQDFGDEHGFRRRYKDPKKLLMNGNNTVVLERLNELNERLRSTCMVRRLKSEILHDLPTKHRNVIYLALDPEDLAEYKRAEWDIVEYLARRAREIAAAEGLDADQAELYARVKAIAGRQLVEIQALRRLIGRLKLKVVQQWIADYLEQTDGKLLVFGWHVDMVRGIAQKFNVPTIMGGDTMNDRMAAVDAFQTKSDVRLLPCSIRAASEGLNLTAATDVLAAELAWTPAMHSQAEDRAYRIGQTKNVTCHYPLADDTIDVRVWKLINAKRVCAAAVVGGGDEQVSELEIATSVFADMAIDELRRTQQLVAA